jgi:hypothetical protein
MFNYFLSLYSPLPSSSWNQLGRNRSIDTPLLGAALQVIVGGVFVIGVVIGMA